jgi:hypothetical protein
MIDPGRPATRGVVGASARGAISPAPRFAPQADAPTDQFTLNMGRHVARMQCNGIRGLCVAPSSRFAPPSPDSAALHPGYHLAMIDPGRPATRGVVGASACGAISPAPRFAPQADAPTGQFTLNMGRQVARVERKCGLIAPSAECHRKLSEGAGKKTPAFPTYSLHPGYGWASSTLLWSEHA